MIDINEYLDSNIRDKTAAEIGAMIYDRSTGAGEAADYNAAVNGGDVKDRIVRLNLLTKAYLEKTGGGFDAVKSIFAHYPAETLSFAAGKINNVGSLSETNTQIRSASNSDLLPVCHNGDFYYADAPYEIKVHIYNSTVLNIANHVALINSDFVTGVVSIPDEYANSSYYAAVTIRKTGHYEDDISGDLSAVKNSVKYYQPYRIDEELSELRETVLNSGTASIPTLDSFFFKWNLGKSILANGNISTNSKFALSEVMQTAPGTIFVNRSASSYDGNTTNLLMALYDGSSFLRRISLASGEKFIIPSDANGFRITYGFPSTNVNPPAMTRVLLDSLFSVDYLGTAVPMGYIGDGERPVYVAFGASTTEGAVHHYSGQDITYSANNYPGYVAKALNMKCFNLGVGSTGFMERGDPDSASYGTKRNIMDQIYANDTLLKRAGLVTIMFGYGNDNYVGSPPRYFPIGSYTDYYPYDEEGYHPGGVEGMNTMLDKGATLMGCLNWCIKWINEKYPYARLVIIFGSPSANSTEKRKLTMTARTEGPGVSPYVLDIDADVDPYEQYPDHYGQGYGTYLINKEIQKLKKALNVPIINLFYEGNVFSWYSTYAKDPDDANVYALFSTTGTSESPTWNSHPNDVGYKMYARYVAGLIAEQFTH